MTSLVNVITRQTFLRPSCLPQLNLIATKTTKLMSNSDGLFRMGKLRSKYNNRSPIIIQNEDGTFRVEGISDKSYPTVVKWKTPEYLFRGEAGPDGSGDLAKYPQVDLTRPRLEFSGLEAYEKAPPEVKHVLSLEMSRRQDMLRVAEEDLRQNVAEHQYDFDSNVVKIALLTLKIRNAQRELFENAQRGWRNYGAKARVKRYVNMRRAQLGFLRSQDYPQYEWLLEKLNLIYKPRPFEYKRTIRRRETEKLVNLLCDEIRRHKMISLQESFEDEQPKFIEKKIESMLKIKGMEEEHGLEPTVSGKDVEAEKLRLEKVKQTIAVKEKQVISYHVFEEKVEEEQNKIF